MSPVGEPCACWQWKTNLGCVTLAAADAALLLPGVGWWWRDGVEGWCGSEWCPLVGIGGSGWCGWRPPLVSSIIDDGPLLPLLWWWSVSAAVMWLTGLRFFEKSDMTTTMCSSPFTLTGLPMNCPSYSPLLIVFVCYLTWCFDPLSRKTKNRNHPRYSCLSSTCPDRKKTNIECD